MAGNGAIAGLVAITAPSGYVEFWAAPIIGAVAGVIVVFGVLGIEKVLDDPVGALSAHGLAGIWGTLSCGLFTSPRFAEFNGVGDPGTLVLGLVPPAGAQALGVGMRVRFVFIVSYVVLRDHQGHDRPDGVSRGRGGAGLDITEHGMYGYPEQFIPAEEYGFASVSPAASPRRPATVSAMASTPSTQA